MDDLPELTPHYLIERCVEDHHPADDWRCSCGEDLFGGTASYSWSLFKAHFAHNVIAALAPRPAELTTTIPEERHRED